MAREPAQDADGASQKTYVPIIVAFIGAIAAGIVGYWQFVWKPSNSSQPTLTYLGRVIDAVTEAPIRGAKVTLEIRGAPPIVYTDSEGIYTFSLEVKDDAPIEGRIKVQVAGYENFDRQVSISRMIKLEDVRLKPVSPREAPQKSQVPVPKLAFAAGGSVAMLGQSSRATGRMLFERSLTDLGLTPNQVRELSQLYATLENSVRAKRIIYDEVQRAKTDLLVRVQNQLRLLRGEQYLTYIDFGHHLCQLVLVLRFWEELQAQGDPLSASKDLWRSLQKETARVDIPNDLAGRIRATPAADLAAKESRKLVVQMLDEALDHFDMNLL